MLRGLPRRHEDTNTLTLSIRYGCGRCGLDCCGLLWTPVDFCGQKCRSCPQHPQPYLIERVSVFVSSCLRGKPFSMTLGYFWRANPCENKNNMLLFASFRRNILHYLLSIFLLFLFIGCDSPKPPVSDTWQQMAGRNADAQPIYRTIVPSHWQRLPPQPNLEDTMKPICEYSIANEIRLTVHNFPSEQLSQRIPPEAQVKRWQRQAGAGTLSHQCQNGFVGLRLETDELIAWAMQLDPELYLSLSGPNASDHDRERRSDYTIKIGGPKSLLEIHRNDLETFTNRFELINPILTDS